ncbi:hypothetical protein GGF39_001600 [Coemansia sp. RSA 1721]|nr:hypothetical protein GGF39_001600 [Coemansia sp. RSA 1721]
MAVLRQEDDVETTQKPTHLMILVPGTGPQREDERPKNSFISRAKKFRQWVQEFCSREFADSGANVHVLTIDYHSDIHEHESAKQRMTRTTLSSIPWIRKLNNEVLGDIFYYFSTFHGQRLLSMVITKLNNAYDQFMTHHPEFSGPVSLVAHSLGGMICYEILYFMNQAKLLGDRGMMAGNVELERYRDLPKLKFIPNRLFTLGTPLGTTLVFRNLYIDKFHMGSVGYHNIFHPYDPFGYRMEPLYDEYYADVAAVPITVESLVQTTEQSTGLMKVREKPSLADLITSNGSLLSLKHKNKSVLETTLSGNSILPRPQQQQHQRSRSFFATLLDKKPPVGKLQPTSLSAAASFRGGSSNSSVAGFLGDETTKSRSFSKLSLVGFASFRFGGRAEKPKMEIPEPEPEPEPEQEQEIEVETMVIDHDIPMSPLAASLFSLNSIPASPVNDPDITDSPLPGILSSSDSIEKHKTPEKQPVPEHPVDQRYADIDDIFTDDGFDQLAQLLSSPGRLSLEQQMAQTQGLPLSSHLLSTKRRTRKSTRAVKRVATASRNKELPTTPALMDDKPLPRSPRRSSSVPVGLGNQCGEVNGPDDDDDSGVEETESDGEDDGIENHPLPYPERMDYIIPATKGYLQNEYWLGFHAHHVYWSSKDIVHHVLHHMIRNPHS